MRHATGDGRTCRHFCGGGRDDVRRFGGRRRDHVGGRYQPDYDRQRDGRGAGGYDERDRHARRRIHAHKDRRRHA